MSNLQDLDFDLDFEAVISPEKEKVKPPPLYKVILNNDDFTPMEFVIDILMRFFAMDVDKANYVMMTVHVKGKAVCGLFSPEIAEMKVHQANAYSREHQHPLLCTMEQA